MTGRTFIPPTPRRKMHKARRVKIFLREQGRCYICGNQIRDGEPYEIEHPEALQLGGSDDDADCRVAHVKCHSAKTAEDRKAIAKRNTSIDRGYAGKRKSRPITGSKASGWKRKMDGSVVRR